MSLRLVGVITIVICIAVLFTTQSSTTALAAMVVGVVVNIAVRSFNRPPDAQIIQTLKDDCEPMARRLAASLGKAINQDVEVVGMRVYRGNVEVELMIGSDLSNSYQEQVVVPYARVKDIKFWQEALKTITARHSARPVAA